MNNSERNFESNNTTAADVPGVTIQGEDFWQNTNADLLFKYFAPVLIIVGTVGNLIAVITLQSRLFKSSSTSFLLSTLALCDVLVLNTGLMRWWLIHAFQIDVETLSKYGCKVHSLFTYFSHQIASWTLVLLTVERTISVLIPLRCHEFCNKRRLIPIWIGIAVILFCFNIHFFFSVDIQDFVNTSNSSNSRHCIIVNSWDSFFLGPWYWIDACLGDFIPFLFVLVGNVIIVTHLVRSGRLRSKVMLSAGEKDRKMSSTTFVLITVSVIFLVCNVPTDLLFLGYQYGLFPDNNSEQDAIYNLFFAGVSMLYYANNAIEFVLYFVSGRKFRSAFLDMFGCAPSGNSKNSKNVNKSDVNNIGMHP